MYPISCMCVGVSSTSYKFSHKFIKDLTTFTIVLSKVPKEQCHPNMYSRGWLSTNYQILLLNSLTSCCLQTPPHVWSEHACFHVTKQQLHNSSVRLVQAMASPVAMHETPKRNCKCTKESCGNIERKSQCCGINFIISYDNLKACKQEHQQW